MKHGPSGARPILEEDLHAYVDHALDAARRGEVQAYLDEHPDAAGEVRAYAAEREELRALLAPIAEEPVPPALDLKRLMEKRHAPARSPWNKPWSRPWGMPGNGPWRMAAAVLLALGIGAGSGWSLRGGLAPTDAGIAALAREASNSYDVYAADTQRPVEMGAAQRTELVSWVSSRLGRKVAVPDIAGYHFIGGRLVATEHGPAGLFMYDDPQGTRLALLVRPMAVDKDTPMMKHTQGPLASYAWADQGMGYGVVGAERAEKLHPLADEMRRQIGIGIGIGLKG